MVGLGGGGRACWWGERDGWGKVVGGGGESEGRAELGLTRVLPMLFTLQT